MLAVDILGGGEISSYSQSLVKFFTNVTQNLQSAGLKDPANENNIIDEYLDSDGTRAKLLNLINTEKEIAEKAVKLEKEDNEDGSVKEWKKIFMKNGDSDSAKNQSYSSGPTFINKSPSKPWCNV